MTLTEQIARDESYQKFVYQDSRGYWTVGYGRCVDARVGEGISQDEAMFLLTSDVNRVQQAVAETFPWTQALDPVRRSVLENMAFNMGISHLSGFVKMLAHVQAGEFAQAAAEMLNSKWAQQVGSRAKRLAVQMVQGVELL